MTKVKKNKMKTHKGTKKVLNVRKSGSISVTHQGGLHNTGKQSAKRKDFFQLLYSPFWRLRY